MHVWVALYSGESPQAARLIALTSDTNVARDVASRVLASMGMQDDPISKAVDEGRRAALQMVAEANIHTSETSPRRRVRGGCDGSDT
jgi:hypothetical protein